MTIQNLNEIAHLKNSACGKPYPRHGLQLLYWFACDCVYFEDGQPFLKYDPCDGDFGFKKFHNNEDLLPYRDNPYYEVGSLSSGGASELPEYVRQNYDSERGITNADRIIICCPDPKCSLDWIYVTRHCDQRNFDQNHTYRIGKPLLKSIHNFPDLNSFLKKVGYVININIPDEEPPKQNLSGPVTGQNHASDQRPAETHIAMPERTPPPKRWSLWGCTIL